MAFWSRPDNPSSVTLLVDRLEQVPSLRDPTTRRLCVELLVERLGINLVVDELPTTRSYLFALVQACRRQHPGALHELVAVIDDLEPGSIPVLRVRDVVREMSALDLIAEDDRQELLTLLDGSRDSRFSELVRSAAGPAAQLTSDDQYPAEALATLERMNARPDGLPPLFVFIEYLAAYLNDHRGAHLRQWNDQQAERIGLAGKLRALRLEQAASPIPHQQDVIVFLVIRIEPDKLDPSLLTVTPWRQSDPGEWCPRQGDSFTGDLKAVRSHVAVLIADAEAGWARKAGTIRVELLLPFSLLSMPADQWDLEADSDLPRLLGVHYQVVVRSLDRARARHWHREWRQRWKTLIRAQPGVTSFDDHWLWSDGAKYKQLAALDAKLAVRKDVVSLVLRSAPEGAEAGEVKVGVRTGVPVMIWHRAESGRSAFEAEVKAMCDVLPDLAENFRLLRSRAKQATRPDSHVGSRVSLLWDDPDRLVEPQDPPSAPAEEVTA
jgi:hypothetical protein